MIGDAFIVIAFWILFLGWLAIMRIQHRNLKQHRHAISTAAFFLVVMTAVHGALLG
ncbi:MAG: hypothetical protein IPK70_10535 [Flavobacteriales bacterium]|jgi:uncharacterized membrane protein YozB (DUF420 family)|nr:hypothetical protein [Flavobacteriales bacterium]